MPNVGCLFLSLIALGVGVSFILFPNVLLEASRKLNRTLTVLDERLIRYRYVVGLATRDRHLVDPGRLPMNHENVSAAPVGDPESISGESQVVGPC